MSRLTELWRVLPVRHRLVLGVLLPLVLLVVLLKSCAGGGATRVVPPPLPQVAAPANQNADTTAAPSTESVSDLRLAERRPLLTSPGLQFVTHGANSASAAPVVASAPKVQEPKVSVASLEAASKPAESKPPVEPKPQAPVAPTGTSSKPGLFAALPADAWLLQVAAAPNAQEAQARCQHLSQPCVSYAARRQGRQVWILVVGPYASRNAALAAVAGLPEQMRQQGPFPRQVGDVRKDAGG